MALIAAWLNAAAYRLGGSTLHIGDLEMSLGVLFMVSAFVIYDYFRLHFGIKMALVAAALGAGVCVQFNFSIISGSLTSAIGTLLVPAVAILLAYYVQLKLRHHATWEVALVTNPIAGITVSILYALLVNLGNVPEYTLIFSSITAKLFLLPHSLACVYGLLWLSGKDIRYKCMED